MLVRMSTPGLLGLAIHTASESDHEEVVQVLLDAGADIDALDDETGTALQIACRGGYEKVVRVLVDAGADVDLRGGRWYEPPPLYIASKRGYESIVRILIDAGANVNVHAEGEELYYMNAIRAAIQGGNENVVRILRDAGAKWADDGDNDDNDN